MEKKSQKLLKNLFTFFKKYFKQNVRKKVKRTGFDKILVNVITIESFDSNEMSSSFPLCPEISQINCQIARDI